MVNSLIVKCLMLPIALCAVTLSGSVWSFAQSPLSPTPAVHHTRAAKPHAHPPAKKKAAPAPVAQTPPPPPMPHWPINDNPTPPSVVWDATGLRINASNSSLQQILNEVSTDTGSKVVGSVPDQRVFGSYGPGQAVDVLSQLLQGSGYNVLLAGDIGHGAPSEIVLTPRRAGGASGSNTVNRQQQDPDEDIPDEQPPPEDQPQPQVQQPPNEPSQMRPGFGPNGPIRTPQQVMEEMQQRQLLQQQQMQEQQQQNSTAPQANPQ